MKHLFPIMFLLLMLLTACGSTASDEPQSQSSPIPSENISPTKDSRLEQIDITSEIDSKRSQVIFTTTNNYDSTIFIKVFYKITSGETVVDSGYLTIEGLDPGQQNFSYVDVSTIENLSIETNITEYGFAELTNEANS